MSCITSGNLVVCQSRDLAAPLHEATLMVDLGDGDKVMGPFYTANQLAWCDKCRRRRRAYNLMALQDAWRGPLVWCADGCRAWKDQRNRASRRRYARAKLRPSTAKKQDE